MTTCPPEIAEILLEIIETDCSSIRAWAGTVRRIGVPSKRIISITCPVSWRSMTRRVTLLLGCGRACYMQQFRSSILPPGAALATARTPRRSNPENLEHLMILISAQGLGRQYSGDPIFMDLAFEVRAGERIGLVGPNGAGKTTLMQILAGSDQPDYGNLFVRPGIRVSLLRQEPDFAPDETMIDVVKSGLASLIDLQHELEEAAQEMAEAEDDDDRERAARRYDELHEQIEHQDAYSIDHRVEEVLIGPRLRRVGVPPRRRRRSPAASSRG